MHFRVEVDSNPMSDDHKAALAKGRAATAAVTAYIQALDTVNRPKPRGRQRTVETIEVNLADVQSQLAAATDPMQKLNLGSQELLLNKELDAKRAEGAPVDLSELEAGFIEHGKAYAEAHRVEFGAWLLVRVPRRVLRAAGIKPQ